MLQVKTQIKDHDCLIEVTRLIHADPGCVEGLPEDGWPPSSAEIEFLVLDPDTECEWVWLSEKMSDDDVSRIEQLILDESK